MLLVGCRLSSSGAYHFPMPPKREVCLAFGRVVRKYRTRLGLSQEELADRATIHRTYIGGIERGERNPTLTMIHRLAAALGVRPANLLEPEGPSPAQERG
jgi:transcriptional regulator with XRE-family HTH domain